MDKLKAYVELTKPRITLLLLAVAMASFYVASPGAVNWPRLAVLTVATALLAGGVFALNAYMERSSDLLMRRTENRPLPSRRLPPRNVLIFGAVLTASAVLLHSLLLGWVTGTLAFLVFVSYDLVYTPLKRRTELHTALGAISGAIPPLLGWAAARGSLDANAWILFAILYLWQFPHFIAIEVMYKDDYARAGIRIIPALEPQGNAAAATIISAVCLLLIAGAVPSLTGLAGKIYLVGGLLVGVGFLAAGVFFAANKTRKRARFVLLASVAYLPLVFVLMVADAAR
ncbi:MAG: heme o synthase [Spirochaetia bacterium]